MSYKTPRGEVEKSTNKNSRSSFSDVGKKLKIN